ncbi:uncharacterized protein BJ171DRAFT_477983 [Polychytrium aggregatum]|uniref:uncharacterized protein n=1 Tax=Polychytrium aggregatum TaxID=110093 RepID=UPI0022FED15D|nr:uncharacterized protein BJ171DRAFT_477983 [Polychytrium aggregatum]KAI9197279.1 hypothetical protein BJ171DRAFT_477983 [Polychytrium aggregatum]
MLRIGPGLRARCTRQLVSRKSHIDPLHLAAISHQSICPAPSDLSQTTRSISISARIRSRGQPPSQESRTKEKSSPDKRCDPARPSVAKAQQPDNAAPKHDVKRKNRHVRMLADSLRAASKEPAVGLAALVDASAGDLVDLAQYTALSGRLDSLSFGLLCGLLEKRIAEFDLDSALSLVRSLLIRQAGVRSTTIAVLKHIWQLQGQWSCLTPDDVLAIATAFDKTQWHDGMFLNALCTLAAEPRRLAGFSPEQISTLLWTVSKHRHQHLRLFSSVRILLEKQHIQTHGKVPTQQAIQLPCDVQFHPNNQQQLEQVGCLRLRLDDFTVLDASRAARAFVKHGRVHSAPLLSAFMELSAAKLQPSNAEDVMDLVWAVEYAQDPAADVSARTAFFKRVLAAIDQAPLDAWSTRSLSVVVWACGPLLCETPGLVCRIESSVLYRLDGIEPYHLGKLLFRLAESGHASQELFTRAADTIVRRIAGFDRELVEIAAAYVKMDAMAPALQAALTAQILRTAGRFAVVDLCRVLASLSVLRPAPRGDLSKLLVHLTERLDGLAACDVILILKTVESMDTNGRRD